LLVHSINWIPIYSFTQIINPLFSQIIKQYVMQMNGEKPCSNLFFNYLELLDFNCLLLADFSIITNQNLPVTLPYEEF
jgi:hypothetical protein